MKKFISMSVTGALALMLMLPSPSSAAELKVGFKIGVCSAKLSGEGVDMGDFLSEDLKSKWGYCVGGFVTYSINDMFAIQPEVLYTMKGAKYKDEIGGEILKLWINLTYLEIPVLAKITVPTLGVFKPTLFAGPAVALKLSGKTKREFMGTTIEEDIEDTKGTDFGFVVGAGIDLGLGAFGAGKLTVDLRYTLGLTTISEFENDEVKNGVFSLMAGISF